MFGLSFLAPAFLFGAAAAAVPIVLHLLKREAAPEVPFSAVRFLKQTPIEHTRRRRLRELLLLALRVAALLLLALAFARPYLAAAGDPSSGITIVAIDTSFSMGAAGQFERAKQLAREAVETAAPGERIGVITFDDHAQVVVEPSADRGTALATIERFSAGYGTTRYRTMLARAAAAIGARRGRIVVVTDLQRVGWEADDRAQLAGGIAVEVRRVAAPTANLAVTAIDLRPAEVVATVANNGRATRSTSASLLVNDRAVVTRSLTIPAASSADVRFAASLPPKGAASVTIDDPKGYPADNQRYVSLEPPVALRMLAVTGSTDGARETFYLERALLAGGDARPFALTTAAAATLGTLGQDTLRTAGAVALIGTRGIDRRGRDLLVAFVRQGGGMLIAAGASVDPAVVASLFAEATLTIGAAQEEDRRFAPVDARHPIFRPFGVLAANLGQIRFRRTARVVFGEDEAQALARFDDGTAALVEGAVGEGRVLLFGSDLNNAWNDFPLHPSFVPFVHEVVRYLARDREPLRAMLVGHPADVWRRPGVMMAGTPPRHLTINVDPRESDLTQVSPDDFRSAIERLRGANASVPGSSSDGSEEPQDYWRYGLFAMLGALMVEGLLGRWMTLRLK